MSQSQVTHLSQASREVGPKDRLASSLYVSNVHQLGSQAREESQTTSKFYESQKALGDPKYIGMEAYPG